MLLQAVADLTCTSCSFLMRGRRYTPEVPEAIALKAELQAANVHFEFCTPRPPEEFGAWKVSRRYYVDNREVPRSCYTLAVKDRERERSEREVWRAMQELSGLWRGFAPES